MNHLTKYLSLILAAILLTGCSVPVSSDTSSGSPVPAPVTDENSQKILPVLSIQTKNTSPDVLSFVTDPVAPHVSKAIASWTPDYTMPPEPWYEDCTITLTDGNGEIVMEQADAQVKVRGNWTTVYDKKPLRIKFAEKRNILGLNGGAEMKNWLLLAEYKDASMLRDKTALAVSREILGKDGLFAPDCDFVQVEINGEYWGMYLLSDMLQTSPYRVNVTEPDKDYNGSDIGYFFEFDGYFSNEDDLHSFSVDYADNAPLTPYDGIGGDGRTMKCLPSSKIDPKKEVGITIKSSINSQEQHDFIENFVNNVYRIMYEAAYNNKAYAFDSEYSEISENSDLTPQQAVENVVDVKSLADMYIISELTCDADIYWSSFYMTADFGEGGNKKLTFQAPWDFDSSMGNKDRCIDGTGFYASNIVPDVDGGPQGNGSYNTVNPWLVVLAYQDWYQDVIRDTWTAAYDAGIFGNACMMIESDSAALKNEFTKNYDKWNNIRNNDAFANELSAPAAKCRNEAEAAEFLAKWLRSRIEFLNSQWHN